MFRGEYLKKLYQ